MATQMIVQKVSDEKLAYKNCAFLCPDSKLKSNYINVIINSKSYLFYCRHDRGVKQNHIALTAAQRRWTDASLDQTCAVTFFSPSGRDFISKAVFSVDFLLKSKTTQELVDSEKLVASFLLQFAHYPLTIGQLIFFLNDSGIPPFSLVVSEIEVTEVSAFLSGESISGKKAQTGILNPGSQLIFKRSENSSVNLIGKATQVAVSASPLISPNWDFSEMGIGGLDKEFSVIFRRAFASRLFPPELIYQFGMKHVRGILLYGPPGTGKTLMARQIGKMLNARAPKIVHGPDILNKYVGESEANVRKLFEDAEVEQKKAGIHSGLHIIIFDEIDAICKQRGTTGGGTGVHDTVVNQLLAKIDGVEQLNNVLVIGMTNRKDLIDEALLRPGRLEVQMEISLPDEYGRLQILKIHTSSLKQHKKLDASVDLSTLSQNTKNYSGAEIEGLVKAATSIAMNRAIKLEGKVKVDPKGIENLKVTMVDFQYALENDIKPMFGAATADLTLYVINGIVNWCPAIKHIVSDGRLMLEQTRNGGIISPVSLLFQGAVGAGKTALAAHLALTSGFPLIKLCSADQMVGFTEIAKCHRLKQLFDDACKSELSCLVIDNIERLLEYVPIGCRFSNTVLQALLVLLNKPLPKKHKLLVIGTTSCPSVLNEMGVSQLFTRTLAIPSITDLNEIKAVVDHYKFFSPETWKSIEELLSSRKILVPLKKLLSVCEMALQAGKDAGSALKFIELLGEEKGII